MNRHAFTPMDTVSHIWTTLGLPKHCLQSLHLPHDTDCLPSSFKLSHLAQSTISLSALAAALIWSHRHAQPTPLVTVPLKHACAEFKSERLYILNGNPGPSTFGTIGGLHRTRDGYVRMHDGFPNHREHALRILGLGLEATREDVAGKMREWGAVELESRAIEEGAVVAALRSFGDWDAMPQAEAVAEFPILLRKIAEGKPCGVRAGRGLEGGDKCLRGLRVVEMSRVIAAPVAGKTLAAHGADVLWITSPTLPSLPEVDTDVSRGKRTVQLDMKTPAGKATLLSLLSTADVFIQSYRPGSLAAHGLTTDALLSLNPSLVIASLSAYGPTGPWSSRRGFDSLVQTCTGLNVADAQRYNAGEPARALPCQALDHGAGYLLATAIMAALYKRATEGGAYEVHVSLAGVGGYLRSLGQFEGATGFEREDFGGPADVEAFLETRETGLGELRALRHAAGIQGVGVGWEHMPKRLGSDEAVWL